MIKLTHYLKAQAKICVESGLHIGGSKESIKIGGIDNPVIRNPITNIPFIPGSSLKGRFRMALEVKYGDFTKNDKGSGPSEETDHKSLVCKLFGNGNSKRGKEATRTIFRDANLTAGYEEYSLGEEKIEVKMDRTKMAGFQGGNRIQERIAAGAKFDFELLIRVFETDNEDKFMERIEEAVKIVELEYLGGSGTRGYGKVRFEDFKWEKIEI